MGKESQHEVYGATTLNSLGWELIRWTRNSLVASMTALGIAALFAAHDSEGWKIVVAAAVAAIAVANLDIRGKPKDETLCKMAPVVLGAVAAWFLLFTEAGDERTQLIMILAWATSISLSVFAIQLVLVSTWALSRKASRQK